MRYILVASGIDNFKLCYEKHDDDCIWAIDGGLRALQNEGIVPDVFVGDNDSAFSNSIVVKKQVVMLNTCKDVSDLEEALIIIQKKYSGEEVIIYNATGGRSDHYIANIRLLLKYSNMNITIEDSSNKIYLIKNNKEITKTKYKYISFFNVYDDTIITLKGFKYNLTDYNMKRFDNLCLSNEIEKIGYVNTNKVIIAVEAN